jgi:hypothetical protein
VKENRFTRLKATGTLLIGEKNGINMHELFKGTLGKVVQVYNPSYSRGRDQENGRSRPALAKIPHRLHLSQWLGSINLSFQLCRKAQIKGWWSSVAWV